MYFVIKRQTMNEKMKRQSQLIKKNVSLYLKHILSLLYIIHKHNNIYKVL
jgi:hypothetical protein